MSVSVHYNAYLEYGDEPYDSTYLRTRPESYNLGLTTFIVGYLTLLSAEARGVLKFNPLIATLKPQSNGPLYSNTVIGTLAVDGWAVSFGTARRGLGRLGPRPVPSSLYQM